MFSRLVSSNQSLGYYWVDPDGQLIGEKPILVRCTFIETGSAMTEIDHTNQNDIIVVDHCDGIQCFTKEIQYAVPMDQIKALKSISSSFLLKIHPNSFECKPGSTIMTR